MPRDFRPCPACPDGHADRAQDGPDDGPDGCATFGSKITAGVVGVFALSPPAPAPAPEAHMPLHTLEDLTPDIHPTAFVAPSADVIGQVKVEAGASIWFGAVLRGDTEQLRVGERSNVQDGAVLHADPGFPCTLHEDVTVGHRAVVHGATCEAGSLVGMGAIMLNGSRLGRGAVLGAGALLPEGKEVPDGMLAVGTPARVVRPVAATPNAASYVRNGERYRAGLRSQPDPASPTGPAGDPT
ncbi:MAG TPA: gamma carbonic anhydrase family protein [Deinococcus radiodurans]|nr:gamma carbonic anhydrase family protein [Deinococcus radiodurans]